MPEHYIQNWQMCGTGMLTKVAVELTPKFSDQPPCIVVSVPGHSQQHELRQTETLEFEFDADVGWIELKFMNKPDHDIDMAVIVQSISFFGISDPKFVWAGIYTPKYPEPWYSQQTEPPPEQILSQTYMGWNGVWRLDFSVPVFTWMHKMLNMGWLYD
jgi:hypothetical protein